MLLVYIYIMNMSFIVLFCLYYYEQVQELFLKFLVLNVEEVYHDFLNE